MDIESQSRKKWLESFIRFLREESRKLSQSQRIVEWDYLLEARQIEIFPIANTQIFIFVTSCFEDWPEEIVVHGAHSLDELGFWEGVLSDKKWCRPVPKGDLESDYDLFTDQTCSDCLKYYFFDIMKSIDQFMKFPANWEKGIDNKDRLPHLNAYGLSLFQGGWASVVIGNIFDLSPEAYAQKVIAFTVRSVPKETKPKTVATMPTVIKGHGAYLYPPVWVGETLNPTLSELVNRTYLQKYGETRLETKYKGAMLVITAEGFIAIADEDKRKVTALLNEIMAAILLRDAEVVAVRQHEIWGANINPDTKAVFITGGELSSLRTNLYEAKRQEHPQMFERQSFPVSFLGSVIEEAERIFSDEQIKNISLFLLEAHTHFQDSEYSQSFLMSWLVHEKALTRKWKEFLNEKSVARKSLEFLLNPSNWPISHILETLNLAGKLDEKTHDLLARLNRKRNHVVHNGEEVTEEEAREALESAYYIVRRLLENSLNDTS